MCGICGVFHTQGDGVDTEMLERMTGALAHRGPDGSGQFIDAHLGLGHTRLSIVDINGGAQPMHSHDQRYVISYNGELYNYQALRSQLEELGANFYTNSDTEVIIEAFRLYGADCVKQFRGMFAFVIYNADEGDIFVARDRLGIKPLFYHFDGKTLLLASEMKSIFESGAVKASFNLQSIRNHFKYQFSVSPYTLFEDVFELPAGHSMSLQPGGKPQIFQYWDLHFPEEWQQQEELDDDSWLDRFEHALIDAARSHTIGEVPIGSYLSGGIDSSVTSYLLKEHYSDKLETFSIHITNPDSDESSAYRPVAKHLGLHNNEMPLDDNSDEYLQWFEQCLWHLEQPQRVAVDIPHFLLSDFVRKNNIKVVYTGDGADEILGGYDCYRQDSMRCWGNEVQDENLRAQTYLNHYTQYFSQQFMSMLLELHQPERQLQVMDEFGTYPAWYDAWQVLVDVAEDVFTAEFRQQTAEDEQMPALAARMREQLEHRHPLNQSLYIETKTRLVGWILWKSDRLSMAHGVEARVPFMDHLLVEEAARMPCHLKLMDMDEKYALKLIARPHLPELDGEYKKRAFYTPIREWLFKPSMKAALDKYLSREALAEVGIFDGMAVNKMFADLLELPKPDSLNAYYNIMQKEWVLCLVLSTQILYQQFVKKYH